MLVGVSQPVCGTRSRSHHTRWIDVIGRACTIPSVSPILPRAALLLSLLSVLACGDDDASDSSSSASSGGGGAGAGTSSGTGNVGGSGGTSGTGGTGGELPSPDCAPLPAPSGQIIEVEPGDDLAAIVASAPAGATVSLADGTYDLSGKTLWISVNGMSLRGQSGDASKVVLDGGYDTPAGGLISVASASDVTIAHLSVRRGRYHLIHVSASSAPADRTRIYDVRALDPGEQAIKINHASTGNYADFGEVACSTIELSDAGRQQVMQYTSSGSNCYTGGIDAHGAQGWIVRDNRISGFWCSNGDLSEHGVHFWTGSRDTRVERNLLVDNARGIGFGLSSGGRSYADTPCPGISDASHYGGVVANNLIVATDADLFASPNGMDGGISLAHACGATVVHNTVASTQAPFASIEWRFADTDVMLVNNLTTHTMRERDGATATSLGNIETATAADFVDLGAFDLHLAAGASAIAQGAAEGASLAPLDVDGDPRPAAPDVGADQR